MGGLGLEIGATGGDSIFRKSPITHHISITASIQLEIADFRRKFST